MAEIQRGGEASWVERRVLEHANPVHSVLGLAAIVLFVFGLWTHNWLAIGAGAILGTMGHAYCWTWRESRSQQGG